MKSIYTISIICAALFASAVFNSCKQAKASSYNDTVIALYEDYTAELTSEIEKITDEQISSNETISMVAKLQKTTDSCTAVMNKLKPSREALEFHKKVLNLFHTVSAEFMPIARQISDSRNNSNTNTNNIISQKIYEASLKVETAESDAIAAQYAFAQKAGILLK